MLVFRKRDINSSSFLTSEILEVTELFKIDSIKCRSCMYWLKCELAYFTTSSDKIHLNWSTWFKMVDFFEGSHTTRRGGSWNPFLLLLFVIYFTNFFVRSFPVVFFWCISFPYLITVLRFSFNISHNSFGSTGLDSASSRGENEKRTERPKN